MMPEFLWVCSVRMGVRLVGFQNVALWLAKSIQKKVIFIQCLVLALALVNSRSGI